MPVSVRYADQTATSTTVLALITEPNGICHVSGRLLPMGIRIGADQFYDGCPTMAFWEARNVRVEDLRSNTPRVFARTCGDTPDRARAQSDCRAGMTDIVTGDGEPYTESVTPGPRVCPPRSMGSCAQDTICQDALGLVRMQVALADGVCRQIRETQEHLDRLTIVALTLLAVFVGLLIAALVASFLAPAAVSPLLLAAAVIGAVIAALAIAALVLRDEISDLQEELDGIRTTHAAARANARAACVCPGCGVPPSDDQDLPFLCF